MKLGVSSLTFLNKNSPTDPFKASEQSFSSGTVSRNKKRLLMLFTRSVRFGAPFVSIVVLLVLLVSQKYSNMILPVVQIHTSTVDMFSGIYNALDDSFTESGQLQEDLSTSEILIMSNLTSIIMGSLPDHTYSSFTTTCFHTTNHYRYTNDMRPNADDATLSLTYDINQGNFNFTNVTVECEPTTLFDYRSLLYENGFYYMLSFADKDPVSDQSYGEYQQIIDKKSDLINKTPAMLIFVLVAQSVTIGLCGYHYLSEKRNEFGIIVRILGHFMATWTLIVFIVNAVATISLTKTFIQIRGMATDDFEAYGVTVSLGLSWFTLLWLTMALGVLSMVSWIGPVWCSAPDDVELDEENDNLLTRGLTLDTLPSHDPFGDEYDNTSFDLKTMQGYTSPVTRTPEITYESEFGTSSPITNDDQKRYSKTRPIL